MERGKRRRERVGGRAVGVGFGGLRVERLVFRVARARVRAKRVRSMVLPARGGLLVGGSWVLEELEDDFEGVDSGGNGF